MAMTFPYLNNQMIFYVKADSGIAAVEDLAGKSIAVQNGSYAEELLNGEFADLAATFTEVLGYDEYLTALMDLQNGGCDAVLVDLVVGEYKVSGMGADDLIAGPALADDNYGIGFRKEDAALRDKVQQILIEMKNDGTLSEICKKWFTDDITVVPAE
jgi:polar amino acid transport system substrate-binding protein